ncbi:MAG: hypothetical protein Q8P18_14320 [Pseudomonadota bacterium]|nr:hypothetical protein [Pseudomonadota bacterium]
MIALALLLQPAFGQETTALEVPPAPATPVDPAPPATPAAVDPAPAVDPAAPVVVDPASAVDPAAPADEVPPPVDPSAPAPGLAPRKPPVTVSGELRFLGSLPPDAIVDPEGQALGQGPVLDTRLRAGGAYSAESWAFRTEWDLYSGQLAGDAWDVSGTTDARGREGVGLFAGRSFVPRRISVDGRLGVVGVEAGLVTSHWGLGMLANDGAHDPEFGRADFGDRVIRVRVATRPIAGKPLTVVLAGDRVVEDETATWSPFFGGQSAWQGIASAIWGEVGAPRAGIYGVYRHQTEADGLRVTEVGVLDLYVDAPLTIPGWSLRVAGEGAGIVGSSSRGQSYNAKDGLVVQSAGALALVDARPDALRDVFPTRFIARAGWASGDGNPDDGFSNDFTFDRDLGVGMVLFDELQGAVDAAAYAQLTDPEHSGGAPDGAEVLVAEGAVRHATFVQPVVGVTPRPWLDLKVGALFAWNTSPISQPFATFRNGGVPANHLGETTSGYWLGTELDWAVTVGDVEAKVLGVKAMPALVVQGGHLLASADMGGGVVTLVTATGRLRW